MSALGTDLMVSEFPETGGGKRTFGRIGSIAGLTQTGPICRAIEAPAHRRTLALRRVSPSWREHSSRHVVAAALDGVEAPRCQFDRFRIGIKEITRLDQFGDRHRNGWLCPEARGQFGDRHACAGMPVRRPQQIEDFASCLTQLHCFRSLGSHLRTHGAS
jgi:hypothetical protein